MSIDIKMAENAIKAIIKQATEERKFSPNEMKAKMEDVFQKAGFREKKKPDERARILIIRDDAAGDFVLFSSFLREVRNIYTDAHITLVTSSRNSNLAQCCPYVDNIEINTEEYSKEDTLKGLQIASKRAIEYLQYNFDLAFVPRLGARYYGFVTAFLSGATEVVGFTNDRVNPFTGEVQHALWDFFLSVVVPFDNDRISDADRNLQLLEYMTKIPFSEKRRRLELWYTNDDSKRAEEILKPLRRDKIKVLVAIVPGASMPSKRWPVENYKKLIAEILKIDPYLGFAVLGGPEDRVVAEELAEAIGDHAISAAGKCSFRESAALMEKLGGYIGNDTGLMHIAAAAKLPILQINCFPANLPLTAVSIPARFAPYRVPSVTVLPEKALDGCNAPLEYGCSHVNDAHCISSIKVETVLQGYGVLKQRIGANDLTPLYIK